MMQARFVFILATEGMFVTSGASGRYFEGMKMDVTDCEFQVERDFPTERRDNPRLIDQKIKAFDEQQAPPSLPSTTTGSAMRSARARLRPCVPAAPRAPSCAAALSGRSPC